MTEENATFKWEVSQIYMPGNRSVRVLPRTWDECVAASMRAGEETPNNRIYGGEGKILLVRDFFDSETDANSFAERCWRQK